MAGPSEQDPVFLTVSLSHQEVSISLLSLSIRGKKDMTVKEELPRSEGAQYATGEEWRNNSRNNEETSQVITERA